LRTLLGKKKNPRKQQQKEKKHAPNRKKQIRPNPRNASSGKKKKLGRFLPENESEE